jgi:hypothetical protein
MRGYFITNMYLSSIQHGIQAAHCLQEINNNFPGNEILTVWAENHKTMYVLNGGTSEQMHGLLWLFKHSSNNLPWATFNEPSLDNALTCIGIIVPDYIYDRPEDNKPFSFEQELSSLLKSKRFAR